MKGKKEEEEWLTAISDTPYCHIVALLFRKLNICVYNFSNKDVVLNVKPTAVLFVTNIGPNSGLETKLLFLPLALEHGFSKLQSLSLWT